MPTSRLETLGMFFVLFLVFVGVIHSAFYLFALWSVRYAFNVFDWGIFLGILVGSVFITIIGFVWKWLKFIIAAAGMELLTAIPYSEIISIGMASVIIINSIILISYPWILSDSIDGTGFLLSCFYTVACVQLYFKLNNVRNIYILRGGRQGEEKIKTIQPMWFMKTISWKPILIVMGCILIILSLLNPSLQQFKEFAGETRRDERRNVSFRRTSNWIIFSVYEKELYNQTPDRYIGFFLNFFSTN